MTEKRDTITEGLEEKHARMLRAAAEAAEQGDLELCCEIAQGVCDEISKTLEFWAEINKELHTVSD